MYTIPDGVPDNASNAYTYLASFDALSIDQLKALVMLEASGEDFYKDVASSIAKADSIPPEIVSSLMRNGREERGHAERVCRVIHLLFGEIYPVPAASENPFCAKEGPINVNLALLRGLAEAELGAEAVYDSWARNCPNPDAAALLRQNGHEETAHGVRLQGIIAALEAAGNFRPR